MKKPLYLLVLFLQAFTCFAFQQKDSLAVQFKPVFGSAALAHDKKYVTVNKDTVTFTLFKFYLSNISVHYADNSIISSKKAYLIDWEDLQSFTINIDKQTHKQIKIISFDVGVDSLASTAGALSGDLDPAKGMYWSWQSGYVNLKLEGISSSSKARINEFQFHLGGYLPGQNALRHIELIASSYENIPVTIDVSRFFTDIQLKDLNAVMIPGKKAMALANKVVTMFTSQ